MSKLKIHQNSAYAPIRSEAIRKNMAEEWFLAKVNSSKMENKSKNEYDAAYLELFNLFVDMFARVVMRHEHPSTHQKFAHQETSTLLTYAAYYHSGKIIYDIGKVVYECLLHSTAEGLTGADIELPHGGCYLYFGKSHPIVEGFYLVQLSDCLVAKTIFHTDYRDGQVFRAINSSGIPSVFVLNLSDKNKSLETIYEEFKQTMVERFAKETDEQFVAMAKEQLNVLSQLVVLVANCILYIKNKAQDVSLDWGRDLPKEKRQAIERINNLAKKSTQEKALFEEGYSKVRYVGQQYEKSEEGRQISAYLDTGRTVAAHFRRGHFRNQPFGKEHKQRKIIYIAPTIINPDGPVKGKVYTV